VVPSAAPVAAEELRAFLATRLPSYMLPAAFVTLDALPLSPTGKLDRRALPAPELQQVERQLVQPRTTLELQLLQLWQRMLRTQAIGTTDNFFALGGHSLLAVRMMTEIAEEFGQALPLMTLFEGGTIQHLAAALSRQPIAEPQSPLIRLQPNGTQLPLFLVHAADGEVLGYVGLAQLLGPHRPVYGLRAPGLSANQEPLTSVAEMAAHYIAAIQAIQPAGPYALGGWSLGGVVAFEMAQQLQAQGHQVAFVALLDSFAQPPQTSLGDDVALLAEFASLYGVAVTTDQLREYTPEQQMTFLLEQARRANVLPPHVDTAQMSRYFNVYKAQIQAAHTYTPQPYAGQLTLLRATERPHASLPDPAIGWSGLTSQPIVIHDVPGDHQSMISAPHVQALAQALQSSLEQIQVGVAGNAAE
jgi:thioesterase domain-containing protein/acyl carrier protein